MLPYFVKTETHHTTTAPTSSHGFSGPMFTSTWDPYSSPAYPLRESIRKAYFESGLFEIPDGNNGFPMGMTGVTENRKNGRRQLASEVYPLDGVEVLTGTLVKRVILTSSESGKVSTIGIETLSNDIFHGKEIIISCGAYRTPQLLLLSGIGPKSGLEVLGIKCVIDNPHVGKNLHDHLGVAQWWKLRYPDRGLSLGHALFNDPSWLARIPLDFIATTTVPIDGLRVALEKDLGKEGKELDEHPLLKSDRAHLENFVLYVGAHKEDPAIAIDGSHVMTRIVGFLPTSRGSVVLRSNKADDHPVIDPGYHQTEVDKYVMRSGLRALAKMFKGDAGREIVETETTSEDLKAVTRIWRMKRLTRLLLNEESMWPLCCSLLR
jgi:choline dehydrogenase-like flavoprotein